MTEGNAEKAIFVGKRGGNEPNKKQEKLSNSQLSELNVKSRWNYAIKPRQANVVPYQKSLEIYHNWQIEVTETRAEKQLIAGGKLSQSEHRAPSCRVIFSSSQNWAFEVQKRRGSNSPQVVMETHHDSRWSSKLTIFVVSFSQEPDSTWLNTFASTPPQGWINTNLEPLRDLANFYDSADRNTIDYREPI